MEDNLNLIKRGIDELLNEVELISKLKAKKTKIRTKIALLDESVSSDILSQIEFNEKLDNLNKSLQLIEVELLANEQKSARIRGNSKKIIGLNKLYSEDLISRDECENKINQLITGQAIDAD